MITANTNKCNVNNVAQSGSVETLRLLLDAECPVTKVGGKAGKIICVCVPGLQMSPLENETKV